MELETNDLPNKRAKQPPKKLSSHALKRRRTYTKDDLQYLDERERKALFQAIEHPRDIAIFELAYHRGLRATEVGLLRIADLRLSARRLYIHRLKDSVSAEFVLTDGEIRALRRWLAVRGKHPGAIFTSRNHLPISRKRLDELMKHYGELAGIPKNKRHFHCLRHTAGTDLAEMLNIQDVQDHLGHKDIRNTMRYVKMRPKRRLEIGERLRNQW